MSDNNITKGFIEQVTDFVKCKESDATQCYLNYSLSLLNLLVCFLLGYQIIFVYYRCYQIPIFQFGKQQFRRLREYRQDIFNVCLLASFYNFIHYLLGFRFLRTQLYTLIEIMRFNIMILITFYYLKMASEEIFKRKQYLIFKKVIIISYLIVMATMIGCMVWIKVHNRRGRELCVEPSFIILRFAALVCSLIFLIITCFIKKQIQNARIAKLTDIKFIKGSFENSNENQNGINYTDKINQSLDQNMVLVENETEFQKNQYKKQIKTLNMLFRINYFFITTQIFLSASDILQIFFFDPEEKKCFNVPNFDKKSFNFRAYWFISRLIITLSSQTLALILFWKKRIYNQSKSEIKIIAMQREQQNQEDISNSLSYMQSNSPNLKSSLNIYTASFNEDENLDDDQKRKSERKRGSTQHSGRLPSKSLEYKQESYDQSKEKLLQARQQKIFIKQNNEIKNSFEVYRTNNQSDVDVNQERYSQQDRRGTSFHTAKDDLSQKTISNLSGYYRQ